MLTGIKQNSTQAIDDTNIFTVDHMDANPTDTAVEVLVALRARDTANQDQRIKESVERMDTNYSLGTARTAIIDDLLAAL